MNNNTTTTTASSSQGGRGGGGSEMKKYKGVRCRKWGKWVSEIRVPGTNDRLWLGSYSTPEAAAMAYDVAYYSLRPGPTSLSKLNFPSLLPTHILPTDTRPDSIQRAASDIGMAVDAAARLATYDAAADHGHGYNQQTSLDISVDDYIDS
ncbi:ethylene-responsive transcription factor ERF019-like [Impatiens glandulifera]|uniref:ethylene-responsive transcription factor ERF019-like n=1 Tax=Impatiens glandulifera TaxID=253017 RepID=UPI001FB0C032|nr:ethylene-responsive transcription factor ERF019-like [Impatiens glandulifera]